VAIVAEVELDRLRGFILRLLGREIEDLGFFISDLFELNKLNMNFLTKSFFFETFELD
jgi:hypothetical protein